MRTADGRADTCPARRRTTTASADAVPPAGDRPRRAARTAPDGSLVPLGEQDRRRGDSTSIAEGAEILRAALARDRRGEFQVRSAIAATGPPRVTARPVVPGERAGRLAAGHHIER
ncbi:DUF6596 domain-containing protein [Micromonospora tulbaghiae]|uniref:DUF6596 domain-containing protein n=1 Tax=Micromonospora TaxID=1873 RepID=UPI003F53FBD1